MEIKEYADRIREEIKRTQTEVSELYEQYKVGDIDVETLHFLESKKSSYESGLNVALDIYLDLVKEDL